MEYTIELRVLQSKNRVGHVQTDILRLLFLRVASHDCHVHQKPIMHKDSGWCIELTIRMEIVQFGAWSDAFNICICSGVHYLEEEEENDYTVLTRRTASFCNWNKYDRENLYWRPKMSMKSKHMETLVTKWARLVDGVGMDDIEDIVYCCCDFISGR